jgi:hypothetical protein
MALSLVQDVTIEFNRDNGYVADMSNWDFTIWQFITPAGTINITATNDSGAITGSIDGNSLTATNFLTVSATALNGLTSTTSVTAAVSALFRVGNVGEFVKFGGASASATKVIIQYHKIS